MIVIQGNGISGGMVEGPLYFYHRSESYIEKRQVEDIAAEHIRVRVALKETADQLRCQADRRKKEIGEEAAAILEAHAMLAEDPSFLCTINTQIDELRCNAEYAVWLAGEKFADLFASMRDAYMQARAEDMRDVARRVCDHLMGMDEGVMDTDKPVILAVDDLLPSEFLRLDKKKILGFVMRGGSGNGHTAILARIWGIPAICGLGDALKPEFEGWLAYIDGEVGTIVLDPDEKTLAGFQEKYKKQQENRLLLENLKGQEDITSDGRKIKIYCNISSPEDVATVLAHDGQGIGLFRSEFLCLSAGVFPAEEEQFLAYQAVVSAMDGKPVVIRTWDIGADKVPVKKNRFRIGGIAQNIEVLSESISLEEISGHYVGDDDLFEQRRGIRFCLEHPEIFRPQLKAIYRASAYGKAAILFPMVTSLWEVEKAKGICDEVMAELEQEGIPYKKNVEIGVMLETPGAILVADELAKRVDFFSVGTNDLTGYLLGCGRHANDPDGCYDPHHPAVLRAIQMAADAAHQAGIRLGICGELAADPGMLPVFFDMGIDELSVAPHFVLPLRAEIRKTGANGGKPQ